MSKSYTNYKGAVRIKKTDETGSVLSNAEFTVSKKSDGSLVATVTTGNDGFATVTGLIPNETYVLTETKAPQHHILNPITYEFTIPAESNYSYTSQPINFEYTHVNYQGSVTLKKTNLSGVGLQGAKFSVYSVAENGSRTLVKQNVESQADGRVTIDKLGTGNYVLVETAAPTGYVLNTNEVTFTITSSASETVPVIDLGTFVNYKASATFTKTDVDGKILTNATFLVKTLSNQVVSDVRITEIQGVYTIENLPVGEYQLVETNAPEGYIKNLNPVKIVVEEKAQGQPETIVLENFINYQGQVELLKVDQENRPLQGAIFKVVDSEGNVVQTDLVSNNHGKVVISKLSPGNYRIIEISSTNGHIVNTTPIDFEIVNEFAGPVPTLVLDTSHINYKGTIQFNKVDNDNNLLAGGRIYSPQ